METDDATLPVELPEPVAAPSRPDRRRIPRHRQPAAQLPVARVCVDVGLAHLDRPFDYLVPAELDEAARPGCRVRVRFAGKLVDGFLLSRVADSDFTGRLGFLDRVVSAERVLTSEVADLAREVADRYAGTLADVLRLAVPPRHARAEGAPAEPVAPAPAPLTESGPWRQYPAGAASCGRCGTVGRPGRYSPPRLARTGRPGLPRPWAPRWPAAGEALRWCLTAVTWTGWMPPWSDLFGDTSHHVALSAALGPQERYRRFLRASRGQVRLVIGTRAAMFAPVTGLVWWRSGTTATTCMPRNAHRTRMPVRSC